MANLDMSLFSSWYLVQHVSWKLDAIKRPQNCWTVSHVDKGPSVKSTRLMRLSSVVTEEWFSVSSGFQSRHCSASTFVQHVVRSWHSWKGLASFGRTSAGKWQFEGPLRFVVGISFANTCRSCSSLEEAFGKSDMCFCAAAFLWKMTSNTQLNKR